MVAERLAGGDLQRALPAITQDTTGWRRLFRQFSFPGGIPSHVAPETPGSIHEGGELGYSLAHAYGAAFDNPDLIVACVIGDGEAETGPLAASWHANKFLDPARDGAVLPILHLNGYKIANPTVLARIPDEELESLLTGYGYHVVPVEGRRPGQLVHQRSPRPGHGLRRDPRHPAARPGRRRPGPPGLARDRPAHPQGLDRARRSSTALPVEGTWRAHQVPLGDGRGPTRSTWRSSSSGCVSYRPEELFDEAGRLVPELPRARAARASGA